MTDLPSKPLAKPRLDTPTPPRAERRPSELSAHGLVWNDDYAWIRAANWREVLGDPSRLPGDIRALLEAENAYADAALAPVLALRQELAREMRARLKEDDSEPPQVDGPWAYYWRFRHGGQHRIYCRRPRGGGEETVLIDGDARARGRAFFQLAAARHSPDHAKFAWSFDELGSEMHVIAIRDVERGVDLADRVGGATGDIVWTRNSQGFLYIEQDENHRPCRVRLHRLGTAQGEDVEIFRETDPAWFIAIEPTRLGRTAVISVHGHDASEARIVDLDFPAAPLRLIEPRRPGVRYQAMDHGDCFYIRTNRNARDFKIVVAPSDAPRAENWRDWVAHRDGRFIAEATLFKDWLVVLMRENGRPRLAVHDLSGGEAHEIAFEEETTALRLEPVYEFDAPAIRFSVSSMARPQETYDYAVRARRRILIKTQTIPGGFDPAAYVARLVFAPAVDGEACPCRLSTSAGSRSTARRRCCSMAMAPTGIGSRRAFRPNRLSLVDRGFVYAIAHVRGGTDKGWGWYEAGKLDRKTNTFDDFIAAARTFDRGGLHSVRAGSSRQGGSAGGMLMGVVANLAPGPVRRNHRRCAVRRRARDDARRRSAADAAGMARMGRSDPRPRRVRDHSRLQPL